MSWDPVVLRKYNTTGHFRLLNQVRSEIRDHPLIRPGAGETVGAVNRSRSLIRAIEARAQAGISRSRRAAQAVEVRVLDAQELPGPAHDLRSSGAPSFLSDEGPDSELRGSTSFRSRLNAIDLR